MDFGGGDWRGISMGISLSWENFPETFPELIVSFLFSRINKNNFKNIWERWKTCYRKETEKTKQIYWHCLYKEELNTLFKISIIFRPLVHIRKKCWLTNLISIFLSLCLRKIDFTYSFFSFFFRKLLDVVYVSQNMISYAIHKK